MVVSGEAFWLGGRGPCAGDGGPEVRCLGSRWRLPRFRMVADGGRSLGLGGGHVLEGDRFLGLGMRRCSLVSRRSHSHVALDAGT